jgi:hypothetical protein
MHDPRPQCKRRKQRTVYLTVGGAALVLARQARGEEPGPLFCPIRQHGEIRIQRLGGESVLLILRRLAPRLDEPSPDAQRSVRLGHDSFKRSLAIVSAPMI